MDNMIGQENTFRKTISESDVYTFGGIICESSPWHIDEVFAKGTMFKKRLVYGMLYGSFFSTIIGRYFPGHIYLSQEVHFTKPVFIGDTVEAKTVIKSVDEKGRISLDCTCTNQDGAEVLHGAAVIMKLRA